MPSASKIILAALLLTLSCWADPFEQIQKLKLSNGLEVSWLPMPSSPTASIELYLEAGSSFENPSQKGLALLTWLSSFQRERGQDLLSELAGQDAQVTWEVTPGYSYLQAHLPSHRGTWFLNELAHIFSEVSYSAPSVERAKNFVQKALNKKRNILFLAQSAHQLWNGPDFFTTEFSYVKQNFPFNLNTSLHELSVEKFFKTYYSPDKTTLFIAGSFKKNALFNFIEETFEPIEHSPLEESIQRKPFTFREKPYQRSHVTSTDTELELGSKIFQFSPHEELVTQIYFQDLKTRWSEKLSAELGKTTQVKTTFNLTPEGMGLATVQLPLPPKDYSRLKERYEKLYQEETTGSGLTDGDVLKSLARAKSSMFSSNGYSESALKLLRDYTFFQKRHKTTSSPLEILNQIDIFTFREALKKTRLPKNQYRITQEPPMFFSWEKILLLFLITFGTTWLTKMLWLKPFQSTQIRYVRRIHYSHPLSVLFFLTYVSLLLVMGYLLLQVENVFRHWSLMQSTYLLSDYFRSCLWLSLGMLFTRTFLCAFPRKIYVTENEIILKSLSYYSVKIPFSVIQEIALCRPWHLWTNKLWKARLRIFHLSPWKKGVLLKLSTGDSFYFGFQDPQLVFNELKDMLVSQDDVQKDSPSIKIVY